MKLQRIFQMLTVLFVTAGILCTATFFPTNTSQAETAEAIVRQNTCATMTDAELVQAIKEALAADPQLKEQMRHLNVSVKRRVVQLEGWVDGKPLIGKAVSITRKTRCVRSIINKLRPRGGGSCGPGQKPCGDICIDRTSECTISERAG